MFNTTLKDMGGEKVDQERKRFISALIWLIDIKANMPSIRAALHCLVFISGGGRKCMEKRGLANTAVGVNQMEILGCLWELWFGR